jgi:P-type Cu2+ transporter
MIDAVAGGKAASTVLHVGGMFLASEKAVVEQVLSRRRGVIRVDANPVAQAANVTFDTAQTSVAELRGWSRTVVSTAQGSRSPSTSATR